LQNTDGSVEDTFFESAASLATRRMQEQVENQNFLRLSRSIYRWYGITAFLSLVTFLFSGLSFFLIFMVLVFVMLSIAKSKLNMGNEAEALSFLRAAKIIGLIGVVFYVVVYVFIIGLIFLT